MPSRRNLKRFVEGRVKTTKAGTNQDAVKSVVHRAEFKISCTIFSLSSIHTPNIAVPVSASSGLHFRQLNLNLNSLIFSGKKGELMSGDNRQSTESNGKREGCWKASGLHSGTRDLGYENAPKSSCSFSIRELLIPRTFAPKFRGTSVLYCDQRFADMLSYLSIISKRAEATTRTGAVSRIGTRPRAVRKRSPWRTRARASAHPFSEVGGVEDVLDALERTSLNSKIHL